MMAERIPTDDPIERFAEIVYACLTEAGRADLGQMCLTFANDDGSPYLEFDEDEFTPSEVAMLERAEELALIDWRRTA